MPSTPSRWLAVAFFLTAVVLVVAAQASKATSYFDLLAWAVAAIAAGGASLAADGPV